MLSLSDEATQLLSIFLEECSTPGIFRFGSTSDRMRGQLAVLREVLPELFVPTKEE